MICGVHFIIVFRNLAYFVIVCVCMCVCVYERASDCQMCSVPPSTASPAHRVVHPMEKHCRWSSWPCPSDGQSASNFSEDLLAPPVVGGSSAWHQLRWLGGDKDCCIQRVGVQSGAAPIHLACSVCVTPLCIRWSRIVLLPSIFAWTKVFHKTVIFFFGV